MTILQTSYSQSPSEAVIGQLTDAYAPRRVVAKVARGMVKAGYGVFKVEVVGAAGGLNTLLDPGEVLQSPTPALTVDVDAIAATVASSASIQLLTTFDGVVGLTEMQPARKVTFICDGHTDWNATNVTVIGIDHNGQSATEALAIATSTTATSVKRYRQIISMSIPAQTGAGGTATIGITAESALVADDFRGVAVRQEIKTTNATAGLYGYPGLTAAQLAVLADYVDAELVPCLSMGGIWVFAEEATVDGDNVYCRVASGGGGSVIGAFRNDSDTSTCVLIPGARFTRSCATGRGRVIFGYGL